MPNKFLKHLLTLTTFSSPSFLQKAARFKRMELGDKKPFGKGLHRQVSACARHDRLGNWLPDSTIRVVNFSQVSHLFVISIPTNTNQV